MASVTYHARRMRIAVDARPFLARPTGVGRYLEGLLEAHLRLFPADEVALVSPRPAVVPESLRGRVAVDDGPALPGTVWLQTSAAGRAARHGADVFFAPLGIVPLRGGIPSVATVHDLTPLLFPEWHSWKNRAGFLPFGPSVRRARRLAAVSEATARDLLGRFPAAAGKTTVVLNGLTPLPPPSGPPANDGRPFVLALATREPRKNLPRLIEAMESLWRTRPDFPELVLAGDPGWGLGGFDERVRRSTYATRIHSLGWVDAAGVANLLASARVLAYPSLYEGFGLPALEALAFGTPVVASASSSLPEVVGDLGLLPDPRDVSAIARALEKANDDDAWRARVAAAGPARAATFTWDRAARTMRRLFEEASS